MGGRGSSSKSSPNRTRAAVQNKARGAKSKLGAAGKLGKLALNAGGLLSAVASGESESSEDKDKE